MNDINNIVIRVINNKYAIVTDISNLITISLLLLTNYFDKNNMERMYILEITV